MKSCIGCKWGAQGEGCSFCTHPKPFRKEYTEYVYWTTSCPLHEEGTHPTRAKYMRSLEKESKPTLLQRLFR